MFKRFDIGSTQAVRDKGDCTVRALAMATGMTYTEAWTKLYTLQGRNRHCRFAIFDYLRKQPEEMGVVRYLSFPAQRGVPRLTAGKFADTHCEGSFILRLAHHAVAVKDGTLIDSWDCSRKCVYGAWEMGAQR